MPDIAVVPAADVAASLAYDRLIPALRAAFIAGAHVPKRHHHAIQPKGAPEATRHFLDATIPKVRDTKIDLAAAWTNEYLPRTK